MASKKSETPFTLPSILAFSRSLSPTVGVMQAVKFEGRRGLKAVLDGDPSVKKGYVPVTLATARGTIYNDDASNAPDARVGTGEKALNSANISTIETAVLPLDADHLLVSFEVKVAGNPRSPKMCNSPEYLGAWLKFIDEYAARGGFDELALRYMLNVANGSWLWRNRDEGTNLEVCIEHDGNRLFLEEADVNMTKGFSFEAIENEDKREAFKRVVKAVSLALSKDELIYLSVAGLIRMGKASEVFPSQEMPSGATAIVGRDNAGKAPSKILSKQNTMEGVLGATIHATKLNNAIRTIDTWHNVDGVGAIAVEPYGANTFQSVAHRVRGNDLYTYLKRPDLLLAEMEEKGIQGHHHFVAACTVRAGVLGFASKKKPKAPEAESSPEAETEVTAEI
jgi:CRISPR-associated protein Csy3